MNVKIVLGRDFCISHYCTALKRSLYVHALFVIALRALFTGTLKYKCGLGTVIHFV
jgi:hypothetical protein